MPERVVLEDVLRINIVGCGPGWDEVPDDGMVWGINDIHRLRPVDVVIDCHNLENVVAGKERLGRRTQSDVIEHIKILKQKGVRVYTTRLIEDLPEAFEYPLDEIIKEFDSDYFGSGVDYAIALAVYLGVTEIHLYGILMLVKAEYAFQKASVEHWLGIAKGRGIKTVVHGNWSSILKTRNSLLYGYNTPQSFLDDQNPEYADQIKLIEQLEHLKELRG